MMPPTVLSMTSGEALSALRFQETLNNSVPHEIQAALETLQRGPPQDALATLAAVQTQELSATDLGP